MITLPQLKALAKHNKIPFTCVKKDNMQLFVYTD